MLKRLLVFIILLVITYPAVSSLLKPGYFPMHDDIQTMRLLQMHKCVQDGQIPCRWVPDMGFGYGYPQFNYYAPLPYYVMEVFHLIGFSIIDSVKIGLMVAIYLSAWGIYLLGATIWKSRYAGFLSSLFYTYFPYHAVNVYVRGAMGETWAIAFFPFIFYSIYELVVNKTKNSTSYLALSIFGLVTSHNISTVIFAPFCAVWCLFLLVQKNKEYTQTILNVVWGVLWGMSLSSFFFLPAWVEKKYVHIETITQGYFNFAAHFVGLKQLLLMSYWGYGTSELGDFDGLTLSVGLIWWMLPLVLFVLYLILRKREVKLLGLLILMGWISLFMIHPKSITLWNNLGILNFVQFPWRFLGSALFLFSAAIGSLMVVVSNKRTIFVIATIIIIGFYSGFFEPSRYFNITDSEKFSGDLWIKQQTISIFDYLPIFAKLPPGNSAPRTLISDSKISVLDDNSGTNWRNWDVEVQLDDSLVKLPIFYFPGWEIRDNGRIMEIGKGEGIGEMQVHLGAGRHYLTAQFKNTPVRTFSNILTLLAISVLFFRKKLNLV